MRPITSWKLEALLAARRGTVSQLETIDAELSRRGVRAAYSPSPVARTVALSVLEVLGDGKEHAAKEIAERTGQGSHACHQMLHLMVKAGEVRRAGRGVYAKAGG